MKTNKYIWALCIVIATIAACSKTKVEGGVDDRLFRPVLKGSLVSEGNWISINLQKISGATSYSVQISRDTFKTIDRTILTTKDTAYFDNLVWEKLYQVRAKAIAADTVKNSKIADLGSIKTARFPTILNVPTSGEIADNAVKVSWTNGGAAVTTIKILKGSDSSVVVTATLTPADITAQSKIISSLAGSTPYIIYLYSGTSVRGWANFTTKAPLAGIVVDLRDIIGQPSVLQDTIADIPAGSTVLLKRGAQYTISGSVAFSKTITIISGNDLAIPDQALIYIQGNFTIVAGSTIDNIDFKDVILRGDSYQTTSSRYAFNVNASANVGRISFEDCRAEILRGFVRLQGGTINVTNFVMKNCVVDSINDFGVLIAGVATTKFDNINITNSTFYKCVKFISSTTTGSVSSSVVVQNCTFNETPVTSNYLIDYSANNVSSGILVKNCILGICKGGGASTQVRGVRYNGSSAADGAGTYLTSDYLLQSNAISATTIYPKPSTDLFTDPSNGNFKIKDGTFPGKSSTGDPRWWP